MAARIGAANSSAQTIAETGLPGSPNQLGLPGRTATPSTIISSPRSRHAGLTTSWSLTEAPPIVTSKSQLTSRKAAQPRWQREGNAPRRGKWLEPVAGGVLGFLAGVVGIGGGIFLAPLLYMLHWGSERAIAGTCAFFILVNSIAGLAGQFTKDNARVGTALIDHWPLFPAVLLGGFIGSLLGSQSLDPKHVRLVTALLVLYVAVRLWLRLYEETLEALG